MPFTTHQRHKKVIEMAKGFKGKGKNCFTIAVRRVNKSMQNEYIGRKQMKRDIRSLWIERINASTRTEGISYSQFMFGCNMASIDINRKMLALLAITEPYSFASLLQAVQIYGNVKPSIKNYFEPLNKKTKKTNKDFEEEDKPGKKSIEQILVEDGIWKEYKPEDLKHLSPDILEKLQNIKIS